MPFIKLTAKQRHSLLNELIDEASSDELLRMARTLLTRASFTLPQSYRQRILDHATRTFKSSDRESAKRVKPLPDEVD